VRQPAVVDDAGAHAHRIERIAVALRLPVHRPHHAHRPRERVVVALGPADPPVLVAPHPDRRHVDIEARQDLRMQRTLDLAERVGHALFDRAVVDRGAVASLVELVVDALGQLGQLGAQRRAARRYSDRHGRRHLGLLASSRRRVPIQILDGRRRNFWRDEPSPA
jgi:hypothetical protein